MSTQVFDIDQTKYSFRDPELYTYKSKKGLTRDVVEEISHMKEEPEWMLKRRLKALDIFWSKPVPTWGGDLSTLNFNEIYYYIRPDEKKSTSWDDVPEAIRNTYEKLGIPEAERRFLGGVGAQYESEVVYHNLQKKWEEKGVIFVDTDTAVQKYPDLVKRYFGTVIPAADNKFAALNTAVWSGGSFIYVPKGVNVDLPLQAYFRINAENMGQFERTLIIADEGASVHYIEGCTAPVYSTNSLHSAVVELIAMKGAKIRYTTIQNWANNIYNLVTKRAVAYEDAAVEWVDGNIGCLAEGATVTTPQGLKTIESVQVGDHVLSYDEGSGQLVFRKVLAKRFSGHQPVHTVSVGERKLRVTANHPFYSYTYDPDAPKKLGRYQLAYVRADHLKEAIVPRTSINYGVPYRLRKPSLVTEFQSLNQYASDLTMTRARESRMADVRSQIELPESVEIVNVAVSEEAEEVVPTWDIEVEGTGNFVSQGFIVHNSRLTMKYPAVYLMGKGAKGETMSIAYASKGQHQDAGAKMVHVAPYTTSTITSKSVSKNGGRTTYRGLAKVVKGAHDSKISVRCDALILDDRSRSDTIPYIEIDEDRVHMAHEATVGKIGEDQLFYLMSRGLKESEAISMIVMGFMEPFTKELPLEYAVEMNRLIQLEMEGSVG